MFDLLVNIALWSLGIIFVYFFFLIIFGGSDVSRDKDGKGW